MNLDRLIDDRGDQLGVSRVQVSALLRPAIEGDPDAGGPLYAGKQHNDPRSTADRTTGNPTVARTVRISELRAFRY